MGTNPIIYPPPIWTDQDLVLFHGTIDAYAAAIVKGPVLTSLGRRGTDFGPGFYTTTLLAQAHTWAAQIAATVPGANPAVIEIVTSRTSLAGLETLAFARGDFHAEDIVYGPVAAFWNQRMTIADADQISFHGTAAEAVLNASSRRRII